MVLAGIAGSCTSTRMPKPAQSLATRVPMRPKPSSSTVWPNRSRVGDWPGTTQAPLRTLALKRAIWRDSDSISISVCSATDSALASGVIASVMPRSCSAGTSTES